jgi:histidinol-phosphate aminotransferase
LSLKPRPEIDALKACHHGGPVHAELKSLGLSAEEVVDFSVSSNPFSYPPAVKKAIGRASIDRYPDSESTELRQLLAVDLGVVPDNIIVGSGSMEIIRLITLAYFGRDDSVLILKPTFGEYELTVKIAGTSIIEQWGDEEKCFAFNSIEAADIIRKKQPQGVFICNPNNPSGQYLSRQQVDTVLKTCNDSLLILDEAYIAFTEDAWSSTELISNGNVISVRSMTKDYALAGLRLGYAVASKDIIENLKRVCPPWNVNAVAQQAGVAALKDGDYLRRCEARIRQSKQYLITELMQLDLKVLPSKTNFFLVKVGDGKRFRAALLQNGLMLRDCASFGLPAYVRIAALSMSQCQKLIAVIKRLKKRGELDFDDKTSRLDKAKG